MLAESCFAELGSALQPIINFLDQSLREGKRIDEVERGLHEELRKLGLTVVEQFVKAAGDGDLGSTVKRNDRELKRSRELHTKKYHSIFGRLEIKRYVYHTREQQAAVYVPTDAKLGLPAEEQSYVLEDWSQRLTTNQPYAEARDILRELLGIEITVRALEHMNQRLAKHVNPYWQSASTPPSEEEGEILVVCADGKGVPMRQSQQDRYEQELGKKKPKRRWKPAYAKTTKRRTRGEPKSCKQMAYLGVVYSVDPFVRAPEEILQELRREAKQETRPEPQHKRFRAELNDIDYEMNQISYGQPRLFDWLAAEVKARDPNEQKTVVCLMDGQHSLWYWKHERLQRAVGILDIYHVLEKLWEAAHCFHRESSLEAEEFVSKYLDMMLAGNTGSVVGVFRRFAKSLRGAKLKNLQTVIRFFHNNKQYMHYGEYIKAGYPIGSGVVEGGCRHVVRDRMELSGMRWTVPGAQGMLRLRTTKLADEWKPFLEHRITEELNQLYALAT
jgi:hypothetical protein